MKLKQRNLELVALFLDDFNGGSLRHGAGDGVSPGVVQLNERAVVTSFQGESFSR